MIEDLGLKFNVKVQNQDLSPQKPFIFELQRSHHNSQLRAIDIGQEAVLMGWVQNRRDHGGVIFVDLRDRHGLTQIVFDPQHHKDSHAIADQIRPEFCIGVQGKVRSRPEGMKNSKLPTGEIEVVVDRIEIFSKSQTPPFAVEEESATNEMLRLEYRYLDLRRAKIRRSFELRSRLNHLIRNFLIERNFLEVETPLLTKATPEGARDYLVPSRLYEGHAYALPQSPQLFKQLLMVGGFERYFQIARCFRDEDLRLDRQPDFTQLDLEMSFVSQDQIFALMEDLWALSWKELLGEEIPKPFPRMSYAEVMEDYGTDKPDLRIDWKLKTVTDIFAQSQFKVFRDAHDKNLKIQVLKIPQESKLSRKDLDDLTPFAKAYGAKGIAWIKVNNLEDYSQGWQSPISKFLSDAEKKALAERTALQTGDILIFCADAASVVSASLSAIRLELGKKLGAIRDQVWSFLWVVDFPMFQWDEDSKRWASEHHPFTSPKPESLAQLFENPAQALSNSYDLVLNGMEMGSGSIRIHQAELQHKIFQLLKLSDEEIQEKFGFFINALQYGAPPHGGIAFGLDRWAMIMSGGQSLRDVIAFPKTQSGQCPLTKAPSAVPTSQWNELHLKAQKIPNG